jgi:hypothetical protein
MSIVIESSNMDIILFIAVGFFAGWFFKWVHNIYNQIEERKTKYLIRTLVHNALKEHKKQEHKHE